MSEENQVAATEAETPAAPAADPAPAESEAVEGQETETEQPGEEEKVTLTKAELQEREKKAYAKANAKAERKLERRMAEIEARLAEQLQPKPPEKLERAQFDSDEAYAEAYKRLGVEAAKRELAQQAEQRRAADFVRQASKVEGFDAETFDTLTISEAMKDALLDSDIGDKVLAYLTQNPDEADRIAEYGTVRQIREMAKLEAELSANKPKKQTNAPPVGTKVGSGAPMPSGFSPNMTQKQHEAWMRKNGSRWVT